MTSVPTQLRSQSPLDRATVVLRDLGQRIRNTIQKQPPGEREPKNLESFMRIYRTKVYIDSPADETALKALVASGCYNCVGTSHSYNGIQVVKGSNAIQFNTAGLKSITYDEATHVVTVGASVTIKELKDDLLKRQRRLLNSGNYMKQTVIGALITGTHGYGERPVMAEGVTALTFLDEKGESHDLKRGDPEFPLVALSFGVIAPIIRLSLETAPLSRFKSIARICKYSEKAALAEGAVAVTYAVLPYTQPADPTIMLHTLRPTTDPPSKQRTSGDAWSAPLTEFLLHHYRQLDRLYPWLRRRLQRWIADLDIKHVEEVVTDERDLDYLYDPAPLARQDRPPNLVRGMFDTTMTAYNLAFFVPIERVPDVIQFIMHELEELSSLDFYLKNVIGVRELPGSCNLPFAANFNGPMAAIDLFADVRDYAWLERLQRSVLEYFPAIRPHWGKSAIVGDFVATLGPDNIAALRDLHLKYYPNGALRMRQEVRHLLGLQSNVPGTSAMAVPPQMRFREEAPLRAPEAWSQADDYRPDDG